ncbi:MAG: hypothetical protein J0L88_01900 [Xanthomonadales bacterium]|nr:hypothetical protein [Xanthomonadales bacterium]
MPVTLTIKNVPDAVAEDLRGRAQANRRSLQQELLLIAEEAASRAPRIAEPSVPAYCPPRVAAAKSAKPRRSTRRLSLNELWQRAARLGQPMPSESADLVRKDRDGRHRS